MFLSLLTLENFRNLEEVTLTFDRQKPLTVIVGANGAGKTNILESIYLLSITKSFREANIHHLTHWLKSYTRVHAQLKNGSKIAEFEYVNQSQPRAQHLFKINQKKTSRLNYFGTIKIVLFSAEELANFFSEPQNRRKYLNTLLSIIDKNYFALIQTYQKIIRHKSALLKQIAFSKGERSELAFWNQELAQVGAKIILYRHQIIQKLNQNLPHYYAEFKQPTEIKLVYQPSFLAESEAEKDYVSMIGSALLKRQNEEISRQKCLIGPHRDDLGIFISSHDARNFASRGEKRSIFISLKRAETDLIEQETRQKPILLFDDIFAELDPDRTQAIANLINRHQAILTTTSLKYCQNFPAANHYQVKEGRTSLIS